MSERRVPPVTGEEDHIIKQQPLPDHDTVSYVDSETHMQGYCCLPHCCDDGKDPRWYYPWDKGLARMTGLCCMWCCVGLFFPCCMCKRECRDVGCMVDQGAWTGTCCEACICTQPNKTEPDD